MNAHGGKLCGKCSVPLVNVETDGTLRPWLSGDNVGTVWTWNNNSFRTKTIIPSTIGEPIAEGVYVMDALFYHMLHCVGSSRTVAKLAMLLLLTRSV